LKAKYLISVVGMSALLCGATLTMSGTASAVATQIPIDPSNPLFIPIGAPPPAGTPGVTFVNCPATVQSAYAAIEFVDGNGHEYGPTTHPLTSGGNVEGNAYWIGFAGDPTQPGPTPQVVYTFSGQGHAWFGQNNVPTPGGPAPGGNAQVQAETFMFHGIGVGDSSGSLDVQASFGMTQSASGNQSGWGHLKATCS
jgi:hypothetical protein